MTRVKENIPFKECMRLKKRILVVENDCSLTEILEEIFEHVGYHYLCLVDAEDICTVVREYKPDLVILDYLLPTITGGELCNQIKNETDLKNTPVIIFSASPRILLSKSNYNYDLFIAKPFDLEDFLDKIRELIQPSQSHPEKLMW